MSERLLAPFAGLRVAPQHAEAVLAPPYDVLSAAEARAAAQGRPKSFLHVSRPEIDLPDETPAGAPALYEGATAAFARMTLDGVLIRDPAPRFYAWRMEAQGRAQTGLVAAASLAAYEEGAIKRHELTRPAKVEDRARHIAALGAQTGPLLLIHRPDAEVRRLIAAACAGPPLCRSVLDGAVTHTLWAIDGADEIGALTEGFDRIGALYIADGHHRAAAAQMAAQAMGAGTGEAAGRLLTVSFPADEVRILGYHRIVRGLNGLTSEAFLREVGKALGCEPAAGPVEPARPAQFGMYLEGRWYRLAADDPAPAGGAVVNRLDVSLLARLVLGPILGVRDPRLDARIDFVGGGRGIDALAAAVDGGEATVAFSLYPTSVEDLMAVADASAILPPKTTW
ncbi:MAG: DUF1015 domain-containing protein, partial [Rhodospirillales bacterium]|nr:DUF1015 domain-containing protein [Rhodospirillales bacterium]